MAPPQQGGGGGGQEGGGNSFDFMWGIVLAMAVVLAIWYFGKAYIVGFFLRLNLFEIELIEIFSDQLTPVKIGMTSYLSHPSDLPPKLMWEWMGAVGQLIVLPCIGFFVFFALLLFTTHPTLKFKRTYNMKSLKKTESTVWPQIVPILNLDLVNTDINKGPWASAVQPMRFAKRHQLLVEHRSQHEHLRHIEDITVTLDKAKTQRVFSQQLGPLWPGVPKLNIHTQALLAAFLARAHRDTQVSRDFLNQLSRTAHHGRPDFAGTQNLLKKYARSNIVEQVTQRHAYTLTFMAAMLEIARADGVLATADFLWLKPIDRRLWYMLNSVGRRTAVSEVAGPYAHWLAEKQLGRKIVTPKVNTAVQAMELAISEIIYTPDNPEQGS